jgi:hypothetical protein
MRMDERAEVSQMRREKKRREREKQGEKGEGRLQ